MRETVPFFESTTSISPGPWWLKPFCSCRHDGELSRMLSEATGARHASRSASWSHLACCTVIEADTIAKAS